MTRCPACAAIVFALASTVLAIINPRFTPRHLVEEAELVLAGPIQPAANPLEWQLTVATQIKGKAAARHVLSLADCSKDHVGDIQQALKASAQAPAILFSGTLGAEKRAYLHVAGLWLDMKAAGDDRWSVAGYASHMTGTYVGGTDMLIRMCEHLAQDPDADVPITAGVRWLAHAKAGNVPGDAAGLAAIEFPALNKVCLFVGSSAGDRLFRAKGDDAIEEITAAAKLDTKSRRFAWPAWTARSSQRPPRPGQRALLGADLNGDGSSDLATVLTNGDLIVCFTDQIGVPGVRLRLPRGTTGPVTASVWIGDKHPVCLGALPVLGHSPATFLCTRYPGKCTVRFHLPGKPNQSATAAVEDAPKDIILQETLR